MKFVMKLDENANKERQWNERNLQISMPREFNDEDYVTFIVSDEGDRILAEFFAYLNPTRVVGKIERMHIYKKEINQLELINGLINYIYNIQTDFRVLALIVDIRESGFDDLDLQCTGFFTDPLSTIIWHHLNPNYEELINRSTNNNMIKVKLLNKMADMFIRKEKYFVNLRNQLEFMKKDLEELELSGDLNSVKNLKEQILYYETIFSQGEENNELKR